MCVNMLKPLQCLMQVVMWATLRGKDEMSGIHWKSMHNGVGNGTDRKLAVILFPPTMRD